MYGDLVHPFFMTFGKVNRCLRFKVAPFSMSSRTLFQIALFCFLARHQGCQIGRFAAKFSKFGRKIFGLAVWLFLAVFSGRLATICCVGRF